MLDIPVLRFDSLAFPPINRALDDPNGLLAVGGDLSPERLLRAYQHGIFPWYSEDQPILWWSPDPRGVIFTERFKPNRSLRKMLNRKLFNVTIDKAFDDVIAGCAAPRSDGQGTWISPDMQIAYRRLHYQGYAHSIECWQDEELVGGLYGVSLGRLFFGESMFSRVSNASKVAFCFLIEHCRRLGMPLIDCQMQNNHLESLGAVEIARDVFSDYLTTFQTPGAPQSPFRGERFAQS